MPKSRSRVNGGRASANADLFAAAATVGVVAVGAALFEVALLPGLALGAAAALAPRYVPKKYMPKIVTPTFDWPNWSPFAAKPGRPAEPEILPPLHDELVIPVAPVVKRAVLKTISFRFIVLTLDFSVNYIVIGELATAAGLSGFSLVVGPVFYFLHESAWQYYGARARVMAGGDEGAGPWMHIRGLPISEALAKTITFRTLATTMDFTTNYVVVGDFATAVALTAFGFVAGPFVYLGHEMVWDWYSTPGERGPAAAPPLNLLPAPG